MVTILKAAPAARLPGHRLGGTRGIARQLAMMTVNVLIVWQRRLQDRDTLQRMDGARLRDIGLTRRDVVQECDKPFWRA